MSVLSSFKRNIMQNLIGVRNSNKTTAPKRTRELAIQTQKSLQKGAYTENEDHSMKRRIDKELMEAEFEEKLQ